MSLFLYFQTDHQVDIITDTLVSDDELNAFTYRTKVFPLLHLNMVVTGTGSVAVLDAWLNRLTLNLLPYDIEELNQHAQHHLREVEAEVKASIGDVGTTTIEHFGIPLGSAQVVHYTYRSVHEFKPERSVGDWSLIRPKAVSFEPWIPQSVDELRQLVHMVKVENDERRTPHPVRIGGDVWITSLKQEGIIMERLVRFDDYEGTFLQMRSGRS